MDISNGTPNDIISADYDVNVIYHEDDAVVKQYEVEDLLEMLGGDQYYSMDKVMYVYHALRGEEEEAEYYKDITTKKEIALNKKLLKMKNKNVG